jgi:hypothetical protein
LGDLLWWFFGWWFGWWGRSKVRKWEDLKKL